MKYVMSDLHGCYEEYVEGLKLINFSKNDELYIIGDIVDRGKHPIKIILDMIQRDNVYPICGNHELVCLYVLNNLGKEITKDNYDKIKPEHLDAYIRWLQDGGETTVEEFRKLPKDKREEVLDYIGNFPFYKELEVNNEKYVLVHAGLNHFDENKSLDDYEIYDYLYTYTDYDKVYFKDKYLVTGHVPTLLKDPKGHIIKKNNNIAIDCGCVFGGNLGILNLDTKEEYYIKSKKYY